MARSRQAVVDLANSWLGKNVADGSYKEIIDIYNSYTGKFPRGTKMLYSWAWCACTWSALAIKLGYTDIMPIEISCIYLIENAKKMGCWVENDGYIPEPGDAVLYDWEDTGLGDNIGSPNHVGVVVFTDKKAGYFVVVEGNNNNKVARRTVSINGRYIRGFITPKYDDSRLKPDELKQPNKDKTTVAREVIAGIWGNGDERKTNLVAAGYNYNDIQREVTKILCGSAPTESAQEQDQNQPVSKYVKANCVARYFLRSYSGTYEVNHPTFIRNDAGENKKAMAHIPSGVKVLCYGYYNLYLGVKWYYCVVVIDGIEYTGFISSERLKKIK